MRLIDYARLGVANVRVRKKRALLAAVAVGLIFGILTTGSLLIQGIENVVLDKMAEPTGGKVLLEVSTRQSCMQEAGCEFIDAERVIMMVASEFDGEVLDDDVTWVGYGSLPTIAPEVLEPAIEVGSELVPGDTIPVLTSIDKLAEWQRYIVPDRTTTAERRVGVLNELRAKSLGQEIVVGGQKLMPVGILPGAFGVSTLSLAEIGQKTNPLNMVLEQIRVGESTAFAVDDGNNGAGGGISQEAIFVLLPDIPTALAYKRALDAEACPLSDAQSRGCDPVVEFRTKQAVGDSLAASETFSTIWQIYGWLILGLVAVAGVVMLSTYTRLVNDDAEKVALYHALGASRWQVAGIYYVYLSTLSLLASLFALVVGAILTLLVNLLNWQALSQIFALAFGGEVQPVFFLGFNLQLLMFLGLMLLFALIATILNLRQYGKRKRRA